MCMLTLGGMVLVLDRDEAGTRVRWLALSPSWGAAATALLAFVFHEPVPRLLFELGILLIDATGYRLSLRFYLLAQRSFGAARTGSVFAFAPFVGALLAVALGERVGSWWMHAGAILMIGGILVHLIERHGHEHQHDETDHEHAHTHDDGHHEHFHDAMTVGAHSHRHRHLPLRYSHAHVPDEHHAHRH